MSVRQPKRALAGAGLSMVVATSGLAVSMGVASAAPIAVLDIRYTGSTPALRQEVAATLHAALVAAGHQPIAAETVARRLKERNIGAGCHLGPCLSRVGKLLEVPQVVIAGVAAHGSSYDLTLTMVETNGGAVIAQQSDRCDVCTFKDVGERVTRAVVKLDQQAKRFMSRHSWLVVLTEPDRAPVELDSVPIGATPLRRLISPGTHVVRVVHPERQPFEEKFDVKAGKTELISLRLHRRGEGTLVDKKLRVDRKTHWR